MNQMLQWTGTVCLLGMYVIMNFFRELHPLDTALGLAGGLCYLTWSIRVANRPQILVNLAGVSVCVAGLLVLL